MMKHIASVTTLLAAAAAGQSLIERFDYPDGPVVPGWTQQRGTWEVVGGRIASSAGNVWSYLTKDGLSARDCVVDAHFLAPGFAVQFGGFTTRHPGGDGDANLLMVKIQRNGSTTPGFDRLFAYERPLPLGTSFLDIPGGARQAHCRMVTLGAEFWLECDADLDGVFELTLPRRPIVQVLGPGLVGMAGYATTTMDDFEFFDAVLVPQPGASPAIGTTWALQLATPAPNVLWLGMLSLGNAGIPIGARAVPLTLDDMLLASLGSAAALGLTGTTDGAGRAAPGLLIPNVRSLVGLRLFVGAVTIDAARPFAIGHISNEQFFQIRS